MATIYMPLLNEGTEVWRPVTATLLSQDTYRVEGEAPDDEAWAFPPGAVVRGARKIFGDGMIGIAAVGLA